MLADNIQFMESVEKVISPSILSFVWFQRFDDGAFGAGERLYEFVPLETLQVEDLGAGDDRKVSIVNKPWAVAARESCRKDVQTASNGVDVCANLDLEVERQRLFFTRYYDIIRGIRWKLYNSGVKVSVEPCVKTRLKGWELGHGPIDRGLRVE